VQSVPFDNRINCLIGSYKYDIWQYAMQLPTASLLASVERRRFGITVGARIRRNFIDREFVSGGGEIRLPVATVRPRAGH
jgi:hypothetical protein